MDSYPHAREPIAVERAPANVRCSIGARAVLVSLLMAAGITVACGGDGKATSTDAPASPSAAAATAASTTPGASPTSDPQAAATADAVPLEDQMLAGAYRISIPAGWTAEDIPAPGGFIRRYVQRIEGAYRAQITVQCTPGQSVDEMMAADNKTITGVGGQYPTSESKPVTAGGLSGTQTDYSVPIVGGIETRALYLAGTKCGWRILLQTFGQGSLGGYAPLFERVVRTFTPLLPGG